MLDIVILTLLIHLIFAVKNIRDSLEVINDNLNTLDKNKIKKEVKQ